MANLGTTICDIRVGGLSLGAKLIVVTGLTNKLILGIDFLKDNGGHIIILEGIVEFLRLHRASSSGTRKSERSSETKAIRAMC